MDGRNASLTERAFEGLSAGGEEAGGRAPGIGDTSIRGQRPGKVSVTVRQEHSCTEQEAEPRGSQAVEELHTRQESAALQRIKRTDENFLSQKDQLCLHQNT